ncbi:MAG: hypothetical protein H6661_03960 [Ardenticatenaceae bacterium]|nr:hypothetical protein [Ardenticatenaceae bacterium]
MFAQLATPATLYHVAAVEHEAFSSQSVLSKLEPQTVWVTAALHPRHAAASRSHRTLVAARDLGKAGVQEKRHSRPTSG